MNSAKICLLLKPDKDPTLPSSYRPITLINADLKIICKALARCLERIAPYIMHPNQIGFIKGIHSTNNTRRLVNREDYANTQNRKAIVVSLDEEKAFVRVNWKFHSTLHTFRFTNSFISWIKTLYSSPCASVKTNY